jgi:hypothetical protein
MEHSDQSHQPRAADSERPKGDIPSYPGGYHSRGVPGERMPTTTGVAATYRF